MSSHFDLQTKNQTAPRLTVTIQIQRLIDAAFQGILHDEVETTQLWQLVSSDFTGQERAELALQESGGYLRTERGIAIAVVHENTQVRAISFVTRSSVRNLS